MHLVGPATRAYHTAGCDYLHTEFGPCSAVLLLSGGTGVSRSASSFVGEFTRVEIRPYALEGGRRKNHSND